MIYRKIEKFIGRFAPPKKQEDELYDALCLARIFPLIILLAIPYILSRLWWLIKVFWETPNN